MILCETIHFTDEENEAQRGSENFLNVIQTARKYWGQPRFKLMLIADYMIKQN